MNDVTVDLRGLRGGPLQWTENNHFRTETHYRVYRWSSDRQSIVQEQDWVGLKVE